MTDFGISCAPKAPVELAGMFAALRTQQQRYWRGLKTAVFDSYRPELHYMRGPGWREKHAIVSIA
jgi:hypothetical protein